MVRILVTGASGFIGSHAVAWLKRDHEVFSLVHHAHPSQWIHDALEGTHLLHGDINDYGGLLSLFAHYRPEVVIHLAANSIVKDADLDPVGVFETNAVGTVKVLDAARRAGVPKVVVQSCYDQQTRAVTPNGLRNYWELRVGDPVYSLDGRGRIVTDRVEEVIIQQYNGPMVAFQSKRNNLLVTPNHRMLVETAGGLSYVRADAPMASVPWYLPHGTWIGRSRRLSLPVPAQWSEEKRWNGRTITSPADWRSILYLMGIYAGDGCLERQERGRCRSSVIYLYIPSADGAHSRVRRAIHNLGLVPREWRSRPEGALYFSSTELFDLFRPIGTKAGRKEIPRDYLDLTPDLLQPLFDGLIDSDGHRGEGGLSFWSLSERLAGNVAELGWKLGYNATLNPVPPRPSPPRIAGREIRASGPHWRVYLSNPVRALYKSRRSFTSYSGPIWCVRVPHRNLLVERKGRFTFCGNTDKVFGNRMDAGLDDPPFPTEPYSASKIATEMFARVAGEGVVICRMANVYGYDLNSRIIPNTIRACLRGEPPLLFTNHRSIRQYLYIDDATAALRYLAEAEAAPPIAQIAPAYSLTQEEVVREVLRHFPKLRPKEVASPGRREIGEQSMKHSLDTWFPATPFRDGIEATIEKYRKYAGDWKR